MPTYDTNLVYENGFWYCELIIRVPQNSVIIRRGGYAKRSTAKMILTKLYNNRTSFLWIIE